MSFWDDTMGDSGYADGDEMGDDEFSDLDDAQVPDDGSTWPPYVTSELEGGWPVEEDVSSEAILMPQEAVVFVQPSPVIVEEEVPWWHRPWHHHHHPHWGGHRPPVVPHAPMPHMHPVHAYHVARQRIALQQAQRGNHDQAQRRRKAAAAQQRAHQTSGEHVGWMYPLTDDDGLEFQGAGQYGVYTIAAPWYPAEFPSQPYPPLDDDNEGDVKTGFDVPFTDWSGQLLTAEHPQHRDYPRPVSFGDPVMTGWGAPFTNLEGQLMEGPGQYGVFTVTNPYDHRTWDKVDLDRIDLEGNTMYHYVGDDTGAALASAFGSMLQGAASSGGGGGGSGGSGGGGGGGGTFDQLGSGLGDAISSATDDDGGAGSAFGSIASAAVKVAVPVLAKAGTQALSQELAKQQQQPQQAPAQAPAPPSQQPQHAAPHPASGRSGRAGPADRSARKPTAQRIARSRLMMQLIQLADRYGIDRPGKDRSAHGGHEAASGKASLDELQNFMSSVASSKGAAAS